MNSISRYVGSGHRSSATIVSSLSPSVAHRGHRRQDACRGSTWRGRSSVAVGVVRQRLSSVADRLLELADRRRQRLEQLHLRRVVDAGRLGRVDRRRPPRPGSAAPPAGSSSGPSCAVSWPSMLTVLT